jgi:hypothetical protein
MSRASQRDGSARGRGAKGLLSPATARWVRTAGERISMSLFRSKTTTELGPEVIVWITKTQRAGVPLTLTSKTLDELLGIKALFDYAFALAEPIVRKRDEDAAARYDSGDDSLPRVYRGAPEVVVRPWTEGIDGQSVLQRFEDLPTGDTEEERAANTAGGVGGQVDQRVQSPHAPADYDEAVSQYQELRQSLQDGDTP